MKIVICGAAGFIGKALTQHFMPEHQVRPVTHQDLDITDFKAVEQIMLAEHPDLIINCAVLGVDVCELDPFLAWSVNVTGAENLARCAASLDAKMLHLSTNYVFDGKRKPSSSYTIKDEPTPINIYGQTKLAGEQAVRALCPKSFIIRTSWVFGVGKENFFCQAPLFLKQGDKFQTITDLWANSTYLDDFVSRVSEILSGQHYATYQIVNSGLCSHYEFALEAARLLKVEKSKLQQLIEPVEQSMLERPAQRPIYTPMRCTISEQLGLAPMRDWRVALAEYIDKDCL